MDFTRPLPQPTPVTQPFWDALREHRVVIQQCSECGAFIYYPRGACSKCWSTDLAWREISGEGSVYTFTVARVPTAPHFRDEVPQIIAIVELVEGPRVTTTLWGVEPEDVHVGLAVVPHFDDLEEGETTLLRYTPK